MASPGLRLAGSGVCVCEGEREGGICHFLTRLEVLLSHSLLTWKICMCVRPEELERPC